MMKIFIWFITQTIIHPEEDPPITIAADLGYTKVNKG